MDLTRRTVLKAQAAAAAAAAAGISLPADAQNILTGEDLQLQWSKAPCRFCGTGCGVMVGVKEGKVVATHGDMQAEVNRGLNCVKGYFLSKIMYGSDRLTQPLLRMRNGQFAKDGEFEPVSWDQAFDEMARQFKRVLKEKGPEAVGMFGSGQWTIWEGYAASKLMRAGFRTNNLDPNARHCMASAAVTFIRTFGMDEPMGCYDDFEHADAFVLWGSNMAEMHPILWTRVTDRRLSHPHVRIATLSTYEHRTTDLSDMAVIFKPGTDLAIMNYIANHLIQTGAVNREFMDRHVNIRMANTDIGYGLRPEHVLEQRAQHANDAQVSHPSDFEAYAKLMSEYTLERVSELVRRPEGATGSFGETLRRSEGQGDVALDHGVQPARPRRLGQPHGLQHPPDDREDRGARQHPLLAHRPALGLRHGARGRHLLPPPPADMQVNNPEHRKHAEELWKLPHGLLPEKVGYHAVQQDRMLKDGKLNAYWIMCNNNLQTAPNTNNETYPGYRNPANFVVVSDPYPTVTAMAADLILPTAMWVEKEGAYGNAERRTHFWHQLVNAPGEARSDLWQLMEFSKRFTTDEVWPAEILDANPDYRGKTLYDVLFANGQVDKFPLSELDPAYENREAKALRLLRPEGLCSRNTPASGAVTATICAPFDTYHRSRASGGRW